MPERTATGTQTRESKEKKNNGSPMTEAGSWGSQLNKPDTKLRPYPRSRGERSKSGRNEGCGERDRRLSGTLPKAGVLGGKTKAPRWEERANRTKGRSRGDEIKRGREGERNGGVDIKAGTEKKELEAERG